MLGCALLAFATGIARADQKDHTSSVPPSANQAASERYFVDFRSRPGYLFGHTFIVYGQLDGHGRPIKTRYAGNYPTDGQRGLIVGSLIPVPSSVRGVREDYQERPTNIYRRRLSAAQYARLTRVVGQLRASERQWNLLFQNCNDFAIEVAHGMGMDTPMSWLPPPAFVDGLRELNSH